MKIAKNKTISTLIALILMLTITATSIFVALPPANAHNPPWTIPTTAYVTCTPGIVGVGQYTSIVVWVDRYSTTAGGENGQVWTGYQLNITQPDGTTVIIGPWTCASALASDYKTFVPTQVGMYKIVFSWPGGIVVPSEAVLARTLATATAGINDTFLGATSAPAYLTVQQDPVANWPEAPLPTDYWTLPINAQNRQWSILASNWLKGTWLTYNWQEGTAPTSAHVLWTAPMLASSPNVAGYPGGIADAQWPGLQNNINDYVTPWLQPIIMDGVIYYNAPQTAQSDHYGYYAMDLYTGNRLWYKNGTDNGLNNPYTLGAPGGEVGGSYTQNFPSLTLGQLYHSDTANGNGIDECLWMQFSSGTSLGTEWFMVDPSTGNVILTLTNVPSGTAATDQNGDLLIYSYNANTGNLLCWNSSQAIYPGGPTGTANQDYHPAVGAVINAVADIAWVNASTTWGIGLDPSILAALQSPHSGYSMNVTIPKGLLGSMTILRDDNRVPKEIFGAALTTNMGAAGSIGGTVIDDNIEIWLANINDHATGYSPYPTLPGILNNNLGFTVTMNYNKNFTVPLPGLNDTWSIGPVDYDSQTFILSNQQLCQKWCYSLTTGSLLWGPTVSTAPMGYYSSGGGSGNVGGVYNGIFVAANGHNFNGQVFAYNVTTGTQLWNFNATAFYPYESAYGSKMPLNFIAVCDGMVIFDSTEHSPTNPLWRNSYLYCVNITDGTLIWKLEQYTTGVVQAIADGYIVTNSQYDNLIYCIGKGPSATTVSAPLTVPSLGSSVVITGTVTDQSPGAKAQGPKFGYTNGVPAVSEASQEAWMEYLYEQQSKPTNATGVSVTLTAIDPNNNYIPIGTATTDLTGSYGYMFTLQVPGTYQIIATFAGSNSYGGSSAQTYLGVGESAPTPLPVPIAAQPQTEMYVIGVGIAIIIAIAIVGALILMAVRKRP